MTVSGIGGYIPCFFVKKASGPRVDYFQINLEHTKLIIDLNKIKNKNKNYTYYRAWRTGFNIHKLNITNELN